MISPKPSTTEALWPHDDLRDDVTELVVSALLSSASNDLQTTQSERPYSFIKDGPITQSASSQSAIPVGSVAEASNDVKLESEADKPIIDNVMQIQASTTQKTRVSPESVMILSFSGEEYNLPDGELERRSPSHSRDIAKMAYGQTRSNENNAPFLGMSSLFSSTLASTMQEKSIEDLLEQITNQKEQISEIAKQHPVLAQIAEEARENERILEFLTSATTNESAFQAEISALKELRDIWRRTKPELYRLIKRYIIVREQVNLFTRLEADKNYLNTLRAKLLASEETLSLFRSKYPSAATIVDEIASVNAQIATIQETEINSLHLTNRLTQLKSNLYHLQQDNKELFAQQKEISLLSKDLEDMEAFAKDIDLFESHRSNVIHTYLTLQQEHPKTVASYLELKQIKEDIETLTMASSGLIDIDEELHEARQNLNNLIRSNALVGALLKQKEDIEAKVADARKGVENPSHIIDTIASLESILEGIKAENPELIELLKRKANLEAEIMYIRNSVRNIKDLEQEVNDLQDSLDELSQRHPEILILLDRKAEIQSNLESLKLYATNVTMLDREIDAKVRVYTNLCTTFPDLEEKLMEKIKIERNIATLKSFSKDPSRLAKENLALNETLQQCKTLSPAIKALLDTRTSLITSITKEAKQNDEELEELRGSWTDETQSFVPEPPPEPFPVSRNSVSEKTSLKRRITLSPENDSFKSVGKQLKQPDKKDTDPSVAEHILKVELPNMMNNFFGIAWQQHKKERRPSPANSAFRRTIS